MQHTGHDWCAKWNPDKGNNHRPASATEVCAIKTRNGTRNIIVLKCPKVALSLDTCSANFVGFGWVTER